MAHCLLYDTKESRFNLMPLTLTRPVAALRVGIHTIAEKWAIRYSLDYSYLTQDYLQPQWPNAAGDSVFLVDGGVLPNDTLWAAMQQLELGQKLVQGWRVIAARTMLLPDTVAQVSPLLIDMESVEYMGEVVFIERPYDIFVHTAAEIKADFSYLDQSKNRGIQDKHTVCYAEEQVFVAEGASIKAAILNAENGPIYIGPHAEVQEGALIRGPFSLGEHAVVNMGAKMRGDTSIGPHCKVGGEISNSVFLGYSNKGHDGFMGNSVIGEWCNLGADTNTSNLKNTYSNVKVYNYASSSLENSHRQFVGLIMGDHSKAGINTMFNTGTVVGVGVNIFGAGFPEKFIPSFSWGGPDTQTETYALKELLKTAEIVMARRGIPFTPRYQEMITFLYETEDLERL
jgi:UDP-N-acetylglucosamine diphosphorylase/glucosamine-1-phosphate N-acetyltransferase